jgi:hypothetical protein
MGFHGLLQRKLYFFMRLWGRAVAQAISRLLPTAAARVRAQITSCVICGGQSDTGAGFLQYFGFPCQFSFYRLLHSLELSSGAGTIGQFVADVPSGLSLTPPKETKKSYEIVFTVLDGTTARSSCTFHARTRAPCFSFLEVREGERCYWSRTRDLRPNSYINTSAICLSLFWNNYSECKYFLKAL